MSMTSRFSILAGTTSVFALVAATGPAEAQALQAPASDQISLQEIVVTAQKRDERLQDVPISITAVTASMAEEMGIRDTTDLSMAVPGLQMYPQNTSMTPYIRGIGNKNTSVGDESAVALYVDGVYISTLSAGVFSLNNIDRVEVLEGPQGTLFGRNAAAGVIQIITRTPQQTPSVDYSVGYGNYATFQTNVYGTAGITDKLAADLAVYGLNQADGWGHNLATGKQVFTGDEISARSKWLADLGDTTITLTADYDRTRPTVPPGYTDALGGKFAGGFTWPGFYNTESVINAEGLTTQYGASLQIHHDFDWARLVSISSYRNVQSTFQEDLNGGPQIREQAYFTAPETTGTQELQLLSKTGSPLQWILGAFYYNNDSRYNPLNLELGLPPTYTSLERAEIIADLPTQSYAGYAQATATILPRLNLTMGVRYTVDDRHIDGNEFVTIPGRSTITAASGDQSADFQKLTWRFSLDYHLTDDILTYFQDSRGFKSGVFNAVVVNGPAVHPEVIDNYEVGAKTEFLDHRLKVNVSAFYSQIANLQLQVPVNGSTTELINAAQADVKGVEYNVDAVPIRHLTVHTGLTYLDSDYTSFPGAVIFTPLAAGGNAQTTGNATGKQLIQAPPWVLNLALQYRIPTSMGDYKFDVSGYHNSGFYFDQQNRVHQPSYDLLDASIGWDAPSGTWGVRLWGKNLTDTRYFSNIVPQTFGDGAIPAAPLTFGGTVQVHL